MVGVPFSPVGEDDGKSTGEDAGEGDRETGALELALLLAFATLSPGPGVGET